MPVFPVVAQALGDHAQSPGFAGHIFLRILGNWTDARQALEPCVAIVEQLEACGRDAFPKHQQWLRPSNCESVALWDKSILEQFLGFRVARPRFAQGLDILQKAHNHSVCLWMLSHGWNAAGRVSYFAAPKVRFIDKLVNVGVRTFLNPGWHHELHVACENCSAFNRISIRPIVLSTPCLGAVQQVMAAMVGAARNSEMPKDYVDVSQTTWPNLKEIVRRHGKIPGPTEFRMTCPPLSRGPCGNYADTAFAVVKPVSDPRGQEEVAFKINSSRRLQVSERRLMFHHRSALCFYPDEASPEGWLIGFAALHMDGPDMQAFVVFVCFFGVVMPLICMVTALLHINKQERCKQHVHQLRSQAQREMMQMELDERLGQERRDRGTTGQEGATRSPSRGSSSRPRRSLRNPRLYGGELSALMEGGYIDMHGISATNGFSARALSGQVGAPPDSLSATALAGIA
jgi:hypothetical protein